MNEVHEITIGYDNNLIMFLRDHGIDYTTIDQDTITIKFIGAKYLWLMAVNYGRYLAINDIKKDLEKKYK